MTPQNIDVILRYEDMMIEGLQHSFPLLSTEELEEAVEYSIGQNLYNGPASIDNNYTKQRINGTVLDVLNYIQQLQPIVTSSGVLFQKHKDAVNPLSKMIMGFLDQRAAFKKTMFKYPKGSEQFEKYNLLQLLEKLNANATYGVLGAPTSMFYNIYVAEAVTRQGRSYISCAIMLFEMFLANNVKFNNLNEIITFIHNVVNEKHERIFDDSLILKEPITREECFYKLMNTCDIYTQIYVPSEDDMARVWEYLLGLSQEDINRLYYKNNIYSFYEDTACKDLVLKILKELNGPFMNPYKPPKEIQDDLDLLTTMMKEYVYYGYIPIDKLDRIEYAQRDIVCISDTDSTIISMDAWYQCVLKDAIPLDMPIKRQWHDMVKLVQTDEWGDKVKPKTMCRIVEPEFDYDFYTDEVIEMHRMIDPCALIPQDNLRFAIINIMNYICSDLVVDYLARYNRTCGSEQEGVPCKMIMKSEFLFARVLLTPNRRNYADLQILQEGNLIPKGKTQMAIMGLPINKSTLSDDIRDRMQHILYEDVLTSTVIDQKQVMKDLVILEKEIYNNIMSGDTKYYKPDNVAPLNSYKKDPLSQNGIVAIMVYNAMKDDNEQEINLEERNRIIKIKLDVNKKNAYKIKDKYPEKYDKLIALLNHPKLGSKVTTIGLPVDHPVPGWVLEFVDFSTIINDSLKNFPLQSIGLHTLGNDSVNVSNIISL